MKNKLNLFIITIILFSFSCKKEVSNPDFENSSIKLKINEIMTFDSPNWIEIYNPGDTDVYLEGFHININNISFKIEAGLVSAKSYTLFFCDAANFANHTNFTLNSSGGKIWITDQYGKLIDKISYPSINQSLSYGRKPDGSTNFIFFNSPTPSNTNTPVYIPNQAPQILEVNILPEFPSNNQVVIVDIYAKDDYRIDTIQLYYSYNNFDTVIDFYPSCCDPRRLSTEIKALPSGTTVNYYIKAVDDSLLSTYYPIGAPNIKKSYTVSQ